MAARENPRDRMQALRLTLTMVVPEVEADGLAGPDFLLKDKLDNITLTNPFKGINISHAPGRPQRIG